MNKNEISAAVTEYLNQKEPSEERFALRASLGATMGSKPDYEAELQKLSADTGVPLETVRAMPEQVKQNAQVQKVNFDELSTDFPLTTKFLSDPKNASVSHDDIGIMQKLEGGWKSFKSGIEKGSIQEELADLNFSDLIGSITPEQTARKNKLKSDMGLIDEATKDDSGLAYFLGQTGYSGRQVVTSLKGGAVGAGVGAAAGAGTALVAGQLGPQALLPEEALTVPGAAMFGARLGFKTGSAVSAFKAEAGFAWDEYKDIKDETGQPIDPVAAKGAAYAVGTLNAALELVAFEKILKMFPGADKIIGVGPKAAVKEILKTQTGRQALTTFAKRWAGAITTEAVTEGIQELSTILGGEFAKASSDGTFDRIGAGDAAGRVASAAADAATGAAGLGLIGGASNKIYTTAKERVEAQRMETNKTFIQALGDSAKESKLLARMPERYQALVSTIKQGGAIENVFIPAEQFNKYFQSKGVDPSVVAQEVGASNYAEASAAGTDVMIPIEKYAATMAKTEHHDALSEDIRFNQSDKTLREYAESLMEQREQEQKLQELAAQEIKTDEQLAQVETIKGQFMQNLIDIGTERSTADAQATSYARVMVALASRAGMDPMQLVERYGLSVSRPMPEILTRQTRADISIDPIIDAIRGGKIPTDQEVYGKNLLEFIRDMGGINPDLGLGGELKDYDEGKKGFARISNKQSKYSLDMMAEAAVEAGYLTSQDFQGNTPTEGEMMDAIQRGESTYSAANTDFNLEAYRNQIESMKSYLENLGIDLSVITDNPTVRNMIEQAMQTMKDSNPDAFEFFQKLLIQHNLTEGNLRFADRIGGLAAPSLAVTSVEGPLTSFGEITLLGPKSMADPKSGTRVFGADIYSPRYPDVVYKFKASAFKALEKFFDKELKATKSYIDRNDLERSGPGYLASQPWAMMKFLEVEGVESDLRYNVPDEDTIKAIEKYGLDKYYGIQSYNLTDDEQFQKDAVDAQIAQYKESFDEADFEEFLKAINNPEDLGYRRRIIREWARNVEQAGNAKTNPEFDYAGTRDALRDQIKKIGKEQAFQDYLSSIVERQNPQEKIEKISDSGTRRYIDHTIENVVAILKKELRGGEDFNYGVGSIRSKYAPEFKSVSAIKKSEKRLVSKVAFDSIKQEVNDEFFALGDKLKRFHGAADSFRYYDAVSMMMTDAAKMGIPRALIENQFKNVDRNAIEEIAAFLDKLKDLPTEYFEAKILRGVDLGEFVAAVVPEKTSQETRKILEDKGVKVFEYGESETQSEAIQRAANEMGDQVLFQSKDENRGYIQIGKDRKMNIALLEKADLSTMLHELGHFYLEVLQDLASAPDAPAKMQADFRTVLDWFGVTPEQWASFDLEQRREYHEKFARGHEAYLMEGKAPSEELRSIFSKFKDWMKLVYKQLINLNVELSDEVRSVFDRIYATDAEIEAARRDVPVEPLFASAKDAGLSEPEFEVYTRAVAKQAETAREALLEKLMDEKAREQKEWWKKAKADMTAEVTAEVEANPGYKALEILKAGKIDDETPIKISKESLVNKFGSEFVKRIPVRIMVKTAGMDKEQMRAKGVVDADGAAELLGYESGDKLIEDIVSLKPKAEFIKAEVKDRMVRVYGDAMLDGSISDQAKAALHNQSREQVLMTELKLIAKKKREVQPFVRAAMQDYKSRAKAALDVPPAEFFRNTAKSVMDKMLVKDIVPGSYLRAEKKASKQAIEAMAKGDFETAQKAKERELLNHHLYREALLAREDADKILDYAKRFDTKATRERIGKAGGDYLAQIDAILDRYEFRRVPLSQLQKRKNLLQWVLEREAEGEEPAIDERILDEARQVNYRQVPISELRAVRDAVKNIEHIARFKNKLIANNKKAEFNDAKEELIASAIQNGNNVKVTVDANARSFAEKFKDGVVGVVDAPLLKMEQMVEWLDGGDVNGPWHSYLWNPIAAAQTAEHDLSKEITKRIVDSLDNMPKEQRASMLDTYDIPGIGRVTKKYILSMALNMGNKENIDKMMRGHGWTMTVIEGALQKLNADDWRFVQDTWDTINSLWPKIAELEKRMTGLEPPKVEASPYVVRNEYGNEIFTMKGGYYPLVYDPNFSEQGAKQESGDLSQMFDSGYVRATTPKGHTKARVEGFAAPLMLDFEHVVTAHLTKVIKDITHREAIVAANKIITNREVRIALQSALGVQYEKQFLPWLRSVVNDRSSASLQGIGAQARFMLKIRANVVAATMGFKATTAIAQLVGFSNSLDKVKAKHLSRALTEFLRNPIKVANEVREMSGEMRYRSETLDRDIRGRLQQLVNDDSKIGQVQRFAFHGIAIADAMVTIPTWLGAYRQAIEEGKSRDTAILEGDAAVRMTQGAGGAKDLSAVQRSNELMKFMTMFYSYFNVLYNRMRDMGRDVQSVRDMPKFLARAFFTVMVPAVLGELIVGRGPDDDEDPIEWIIRKTLVYPAMSIPILRDVAASIESGYDYRFTPAATGLEKVSKLAKSTGKLYSGDMEWDDYSLKAVDAIGYAAGIPGTGQIKATSSYLFRVKSGEENPDNLAELIGYAAMGKKAEK